RSLEGVRRHPDVRRVDVALIDGLPVTLEEGVVPVSEYTPRLARNVVALLARREEKCPVLVLGRIQRPGAVERRAHRERVGEPPGFIAEPSPPGPGFVLRARVLCPVEGERAEVDRQLRVPHEGQQRSYSHAALARRLFQRRRRRWRE